MLFEKTVLVTGASGFVGGQVLHESPDSWRLHGLSRTTRFADRDNLVQHPIDLLNTAGVAELFESTRPETVIHSAAVADIDYCESHPEEASALNVEVTRHLVTLARAHDSRFVFLSTDTVFDGEKGNYGEDDAPIPINYYARTKVEAEQVVREILPSAVIARVSLVMGLPLGGAGNSFLMKMLETLKKGGVARFPDHEIRSPIDVVTLARSLVELAGNGFSGTIHLAGNTRVSRYDLGLRIAEWLDYPAESIAAVKAEEMAGRAPRPRDVSLNNERARNVLSTPMCTVDEAFSLIF